MELYIKQLEDENLRLKLSNKSLRTNNKSLLEGNKKLQSQIEKFKCKRIQELKKRIDEYYDEIEKRRKYSISQYNGMFAQQDSAQLIALEKVKCFMEEIGI